MSKPAIFSRPISSCWSRPRATRWSAAAPGEVPFRVVYEGQAVIVVDKPPGLVVHPDAAHRSGTLVSGLLASYPELAQLPELGCGQSDRPGIVHRLDKDTSGLLVIARTPDAYRSLTAQMAARSVRRTYLALACGALEAEAGESWTRRSGDRSAIGRGWLSPREDERRVRTTVCSRGTRAARGDISGAAAGDRPHPSDPGPPGGRSAIPWSGTPAIAVTAGDRACAASRSCTLRAWSLWIPPADEAARLQLPACPTISLSCSGSFHLSAAAGAPRAQAAS